MDLLRHLSTVERKYKELEASLGDPQVAGTPSRYRELAMQFAELRDVYRTLQEYRSVVKTEEEASSMLADSAGDEELAQWAGQELEEARARRDLLESKLKFFLLPKDPNDGKNVLLEIRAGTGGEEASLFAMELLRMYSRFAETSGWRVQMMSLNESESGGLKEGILLLSGKNVYQRLKFESGVHRVQRVPATESSGRIHTSAVTVAVLPEAEEVDVDIDPNELRIDFYRSSGPGGQSVNTTDSAVRITHKPTGLVVTCQDEKSQHKNKAKALKILRSRLMDRIRREQQAKISAQRRSQVGTGDRSAKIRTYNFSQGRVTDHRAGVTVYKLDSILQGGLASFLGEVSSILLSRAFEERLAEEEARAS